MTARVPGRRLVSAWRAWNGSAILDIPGYRAVVSANIELRRTCEPRLDLEALRTTGGARAGAGRPRSDAVNYAMLAAVL